MTGNEIEYKKGREAGVVRAVDSFSVSVNKGQVLKVLGGGELWLRTPHDWPGRPVLIRVRQSDPFDTRADEGDPGAD